MLSTLTIVGIPIRADIKLHELPCALAQECPDLVVFERRLVPGRIMAAAFDWVAVLSTTADLLAIAGALWTVYTNLIQKRKRPDAKESPAFFIQVKTEQQTFVQLVIDKDTTRETFTEEFTETVSGLRAAEGSHSKETIIEEYERSESYRRVHVRKDA